MELHNILFVITTFSIFFNGYSLRKKYIIGILASSLFALIPPITDTITEGVPKYGQIIANAPASAWISAILYVVIVWTMGYIAGGINLKKKKYSDDFPGKVVNYMRFDLDKK